MKIPGKIGSIKAALLTDIRNGTLSAGEKIPSRQQCMARFKCARASVDRAVGELMADGVLFARQGSGTFVAEAAPEPPDIRMLYMVGYYGRFGERYFEPGSAEAELRKKFPCRLCDYSKLAIMLDKMAHPGNAVIWKTPGYRYLTAIDFLDKAHVAQVLIARTYEPYNYITIDADAGIDAGLEFLSAGGEENIGFVSNAPTTAMPYLAERQLSFYQNLMRRRLRVPPEWLMPDFPREEGARINGEQMEFAAGRLFDGKNSCRAVYLTYALWYDAFVAAAARRGKRPGRDFRLLVFDRPEEWRSVPGVAVIRQDYGQTAEKIAEWLAAHGVPPLHLKLRPILEQ